MARPGPGDELRQLMYLQSELLIKSKVIDFCDTSSIESFVSGSESDVSDQMEIVSGVSNHHQDELLADSGDELEVLDDPDMLMSET